MKNLTWTALAAALLVPIPGASQDVRLEVSRDDGTAFDLPIRDDRGYAVISDAGLARLGWRVTMSPGGLEASYQEHTVSLELDTPFFRWNSDLRQLVSSPYSENGAVWLPVQLFLDFLPARIPDRYAATGPNSLSVVTGSLTGSARAEVPTPVSEDSGSVAAAPDSPTSVVVAEAKPSGDAPDPSWGLVVIDPGHGGRDPGAVGPGGRREKDIALSIGRALARELASRDGIEVRMTRDRDQLIPLWERGHMATEWKRDRPAVFISIHANSLPGRASVRGFETYFLSEARTEHEARVAENENAPLALRDDDAAESDQTPGLDFILRDLRNRDHLLWSSILAEEVQRGMESVHPGPNRGVKQAPFAVITNALMPAVLVEVGFVTNPNEERVLSRGEFQTDIARSMAEALDRFFDRYPRSGVSGGDLP